MATATNTVTNEDLAELYKKAGIDPQAPAGAEGEAKPGTKAAEETVFSRTVKIAGQERTYTGSTPDEVLAQVVAAVEAQPAATAEKKIEAKPQPKQFSADELFAIGLEVQKGDVKAIDAYLKDSGFLDRALAEQGLTLDALKSAVKNSATVANQTAATNAVNAWLNQPDNDYPGGKGNSKIIGYTVAALGLPTDDPASYQKAYEQMKADGMVLPNPEAEKGKEAPAKKKVAGSTAFATGAEHETRKAPADQVPTISKAWWEKLKPYEQQQHYNELVSQGHDPAKVKFTA
jgi:hypothetical protein